MSNIKRFNKLWAFSLLASFEIPYSWAAEMDSEVMSEASLDYSCPQIGKNQPKVQELLRAIANGPELKVKHKFNFEGYDWYIDSIEVNGEYIPGYLSPLYSSVEWAKTDFNPDYLNEGAHYAYIIDTINFVKKEIIKDRQGTRMRCYYEGLYDTGGRAPFKITRFIKNSK